MPHVTMDVPRRQLEVLAPTGHYIAVRIGFAFPIYEEGSCLSKRIFSQISYQQFRLINSPVILAPFCFFEMQMEGVFGQALELRQPYFGQAPKAFDAIDVYASTGEFVLGMIDAVVAVSKID